MRVEALIRPEDVLPEVVSRIFATGKITRTDEQLFYRLMAADAPLSTDMVEKIRAVLDRLQMGLLKVSD